MSPVARAAAALLVAASVALAAAPAYNITLVSDAAPDFTDLPSYLHSVTSQWATPQEKAIALWRWSHLLRKQTSVPSEGGDDVRDPILFFTSYGYTNCGIISGVNNALWLNLGWQARYDQLGDHTVSECSWDGGKTWHMFDDSMSFYCFNDRDEVASTPEIKAHPEFYLKRFAPECGTNPVKDEHDGQGWRQASDHPVDFQRTLANGVKSFMGSPELNVDHLAIQWGRRFAITLRPDESYTRLGASRHGQESDPRTYRPVDGKNVEDGELRGCIRANGIWHYAPQVRDPATRALIFSDQGAMWTTEGVRGPGFVIFKVDAANVVTSASLTVTATGASVSVSVDAGTHWQPVPVTAGLAQLPETVGGRTEYLLRVDLAEAGLLSALNVETITQINRTSLPGLRRGLNHIQLRLGDQAETLTVAPGLAGSRYLESALTEDHVAVNPNPYFNVTTLAPAASGVLCGVTWKIDTPTPIVDVEYGGNVCVKAWDGNAGWAALQHSWDGRTFTEDFKKSDAALPFDQVRRVKVGAVPPDTRSVWLRYAFETSGDPAKFWHSPGFASALMEVHHQPRVRGFSPIEVTYDWIEHRATGDLERRHTEVVLKPRHDYTIRVGGFRDPDLKWVRMNLATPSTPTPGYSDGEAATVATSADRAVYRWGSNLALGRSYTLTGDQDSRNSDAGGDLTDGIIAPPETYVSAKWMPTNVIFKPGSTPRVTIDLGAAQSVAAVRVHAGQAADFHLTFPESILVETSQDGRSFALAGFADFDQVFDPPADFAPWELEDSATLATLPAGGRLAFGYRVILPNPVKARYVRVTCAPHGDWGTMLSEIQIFDRVRIDRRLPPAVALGPVATSR